MVRILFVVSMLALAGCTQLDPGVTYPCTADRRCHSAELTCWADGYCRPGTEPDDGGVDAGVDGGALHCECPQGLACGHYDAGAGCGALFCGVCAAGLECGVTTPNTCAPARVCRPDGWCFENPLPHGVTINAAWSPDGRRVFLAGDDATLLEWDGERHRPVALPQSLGVSGIDFRGVHGFSGDDYFVVGTHATVLHFVDGGWQRERIGSVVNPRIDVVLAGEPTVAFGEFNTVFVRDGGTWSSTFTVGFGGGIFNDALQTSDGVQFAIGTNISDEQAELTGPGPAGRWRIRDESLGLRRGAGLAELDGELYLVGERLDGGGALLRWVPDAGVKSELRFDEPLRSVRAGEGELLVLGAGRLIAQVPAALARADEPLVWSQGVLHTVAGGTTFSDGGVLPPPPVEHNTPGRLTSSALTRWGWLAEGAAGQGVFIARDGGYTVLSGGVRGPRVADLCEENGALWAPAAEPCLAGVCTYRIFQSDAGAWGLLDVLRRDAGELGLALRCQTTPLGRAVGTTTSRTILRNGPTMWTDDAPTDTPSNLPTARDFYVSHYTEGWFVSTGSSLVHSKGNFVSNQPSTVVSYDAGGDEARAVGGVFIRLTYAAGDNGLVLALLSDGGLEQQRVGTETLQSVSGVALPDGGPLVWLAGDRGALFRLVDEAAGFQAVPFGAGVDLQQVAVSPSGDTLLLGRVNDGGSARELFHAPPGGGFAAVPFAGSTRPAVLVRRTDAGVEAWLGGDQGVMLRRALP